MRLRSRTRRAAQRLAALIAVITLVLWPYERQRPDGLCGQRQGCIRVVNSEKWRPRALSPSRINRRLSPRVRCASDNACVSCAAQAITYHRECWQPCSSYAHSAPMTAAVRDGLAKTTSLKTVALVAIWNWWPWRPVHQSWDQLRCACA